MRFAKYHGTGNDFVMVEDLDDRLRLEPALIAALCDRHKGVGADGLIRIAPGRAAGSSFFMDYSNADGAVAEMCGNGIRCLGKYVYDRGLTSAAEIDVDTRAGVKHLWIEAEEGMAREVTVDMGPPSLDRGAIPMDGDRNSTFIGQSLDMAGHTCTATALSMGNPHCVVFLEQGEDMQQLDVERLGREIERLPAFPRGTNVEFVQVVMGQIYVLVWERGSGRTMACGTGACAALVACSLQGLTGRQAELSFPGGRLRAAWRDNGHVLLTGPAVCVFEGDLDPAWEASMLEPVWR
jgi:diaminopimelate epimerase